MTCFLSHIKGQNSYFLYLSWLMCLFWEKSLPLHFCVLGKHPNRHKELQMTTPSHLLLHGSHVLLCSIGFSWEGSFSDWVDGKCWHLLGSKEIICFCTLDSIPSRGRMKLKKQKKNPSFYMNVVLQKKRWTVTLSITRTISSMENSVLYPSIHFRISSRGLKFFFLYRRGFKAKHDNLT